MMLLRPQKAMMVGRLCFRRRLVFLSSRLEKNLHRITGALSSLALVSVRLPSSLYTEGLLHVKCDFNLELILLCKKSAFTNLFGMHLDIMQHQRINLGHGMYPSHRGR